MNTNIKKGDTVEIISGATDDKGKRGEVIKVHPDEGRLVVQGVNLHTKHQRQVQSKGRTINPGKLKLETPIHLSNVMLVCPKCNKTTRIGLSREVGKSSRVCKKCESIIDE